MLATLTAEGPRKGFHRGLCHFAASAAAPVTLQPQLLLKSLRPTPLHEQHSMGARTSMAPPSILVLPQLGFARAVRARPELRSPVHRIPRRPAPLAE
eukprot:3329127-Alexandrium_andersonii.AAC.1